MADTPRRPRYGAGALLGAAALAAALVLGGCSPHAEEAPAAASASPYVAVARGRVDVEGGLLQLGAPVAGTVAQVAVHEGEEVKKGALLAALDAQSVKLDVDSARAALAQAEAQAKLLEVRVQSARRDARRMASAAQSGVVNGKAADDAQAALAELEAQRAVEQATIAQARENLARAEFAVRQMRLVAPRAAQVVRIAVQPGVAVAPGTAPLFTLLPDAPRIVRAELNESYADAVHSGMQARVEVGDGGASWPATVARVAPVYSDSTLIDDPARRANTRSLECVLTLDPKAPLRVGQRVIVRILAADGAAKPAG